MTDATTPGRHVITAQVKAMRAWVDTQWPGLRPQLSEDPIRAISELEDIHLRTVPDQQVAGSRCDVAGIYLGDETPPVLVVAEAASGARRSFSALHELGHHIQQSDIDLVQTLADQPDAGIMLEERACDEFAATTLIPDEVVAQHIGDRGPTAADVVSLWEATKASREAAVVRAAAYLQGPGIIVLVDEEGIVSISSSRDIPRLKRGSDQSGVGLMRTATRSATGHATGKVRFGYRDGIVGAELYADIRRMDGYFVIVAVEQHAPWLNFAPPARDQGPVGKSWVCEHPTCGHEFRSYDPPCKKCGVPKCPACERCACALRATERVCDDCHMSLPLHRFKGDSKICSDCLD